MSKCIIFHVYIITALRLFSSTIHVNISNKGNQKVAFSRGGHHDQCTSTCYLMVLFLLAQIKKKAKYSNVCFFTLPDVTTIREVFLRLIKPLHFVFTSQTKRGHIFCSATPQVKGEYAAALSLTLSLLPPQKLSVNQIMLLHRLAQG